MNGSDGDITIFDINEISDMSTYQNPTTPPIGIKYVVINGKIAVKDQTIINGNLGKSIRA